jgi:hypothetical protein
MFDLWKLKWYRWRTERRYDKEHKKLVKKKASSDEYGALQASEHFEIQDIDYAIAHKIGNALYREAISLDIQTPSLNDNTKWMHDDGGTHMFLTPLARAELRKLIDAEKARRFEVKTLWVTKFWLPLLAALVGIIGAITGLVAVLRHTK